ncbi:DNA-directed RNA polymerase I subunit RPA2 [Nematocida sp. AWRm77]|nr:DNA-directed RNA polymerase I subunit RPA2 [Nematocida sp. AWRm77]
MKSTETRRSTERLAQPHIDSYNAFVNTSIPQIVRAFQSVSVRDKLGNILSISLDSLVLGKPVCVEKGPGRKHVVREAFPSECRVSGRTYKAEITAQVTAVKNEMNKQTETLSMGYIPVMVGSELCHLSRMSPSERIRAKEEEDVIGGFFISNGVEKVCRLIQTQKKYVPYGLYRPSMAKKTKGLTSHAVGVKTAFPDGRASAFTVHYLADHSVKVRVGYKRREYYIPLPLVVRALSGKTDKEFYDSLCSILPSDPEVVEYVDLLLQTFSFHPVHTQSEALVYLGNKFRILGQITRKNLSMAGRAGDVAKLKESLPEEPDKFEELLKEHIEIDTDMECGTKFLKETIGVHLDTLEERYQLLVVCVAKLLLQAMGKITPDRVDTLMSHEAITAQSIFAEILADKMITVRRVLLNNLLGNIILGGKEVTNPMLIKDMLSTAFFDISSPFQKLLSSGNVNIENQNNFSMMQTTGFSIIAERLNHWRFFSHFRSVHRGAYFEKMRISSIRKLLPESWGFLCPVHTPDGSPCGLLTHMAHQCDVSYEAKKMPAHELVALGMSPVLGNVFAGVPVLQNGTVVGQVPEKFISSFISHIRKKKIQERKYMHTEVFYQTGPSVQPLVVLLNTPGRFVRPVLNIQENQVEYIGSTEQVFLQLENLGGTPTHMPTHREISPDNILSIVAGSTPLGNFNPSPRNMYQCQMAKQSMGTTPHSQAYRRDNKTYSFDYPQEPLLQTSLYSKYNLANYPIGKNITIAILSYTGYDIEDAVVLNKASVDRGFMRGTILKTEKTEFQNEEKIMALGTLAGEDGLPEIGQSIEEDTVLYTAVNTKTLEETQKKYKGTDTMRVEAVSIFNSETGQRHAHIKCRVPRVPTIGDKFSSRHGQKGVCSILYEDEDMPFSETGMTPDLIINPHAFPSRMSIGMFIENIATKAGAFRGEFQDGTMFKYGENQKAHEYFGALLEERGFKRSGGETLYSGVTGEPLKVDVFFGTVYYQRLRHMVGDKYQVRGLGPIHNLTKQPIGGRKRKGGIRLGEMERDVLIAHGAVSLIQDRLMHCSDGTVQRVCKACGSLCFFKSDECTGCKSSRNVVSVPFPYVFKYFVTELASMNIECKVKLDRTECAV